MQVMKSLRILSLGVLALAFGGTLAADFPPEKKKFIAHGWDLLAVTPEEVLAHADAFDRTGIDGVTLMLRMRLSDGRQIAHSTIMNDPLWPRAELEKKIPVFREIVKHPSLRESFLSSWWAPRRRLKWTDDAAWATFAANMGTVAHLAKTGGLRGILVDAEDYPRSAQYELAPDDPAYDEAAQLARRRGREVFKAIFDEYPDITFLSFWMLTFKPIHFQSLDPMGSARSSGDLWPWFVNGMLDVMPPAAKFIDGNEGAYRFEAARGDFFRNACEQRVKALGLVAPENRAKYRAQLRAGFGLYLDSYIVPTNSVWYMGPENGSRLAHYVRNLSQATEAADEYVWVYGEKYAWVPWRDTQNRRFANKPTWDDRLPGFNAEMFGVKDPLAYAEKTLAECAAKGALVNLFAGTESKWGQWQEEKLPKGKMGRTEKGVFLEGCPKACHIAKFEGVKGGERYVVKMRTKGASASSVVYWQKNRRWRWEFKGTPVVFTPAAGDGWCEGMGLVCVPEGVDCLALQLCAHERPGERVDFEDVRLYRLTPTEVK